MAQNPPDMKIRLSSTLRAQIEAAAEANNRTLNSEIVTRLEASFRDDAEVGDARSKLAAERLLRGPGNDLEKRVDELQAQVEALQGAVRNLTITGDTYHLETRVRALEGRISRG